MDHRPNGLWFVEVDIEGFKVESMADVKQFWIAMYRIGNILLKENGFVINPLAAVGLVEGAFRYYVKPEITAKRTWAAIGTIVVAHELLCPPGELLSEGADRAIEKHPWIPLAGAILLAHVVNAVDERYDLVHQAFRFIKPVV